MALDHKLTDKTADLAAACHIAEQLLEQDHKATMVEINLDRQHLQAVVAVALVQSVEMQHQPQVVQAATEQTHIHPGFQ